MAVKWAVEISVIDLAENRIKATYRRTDDLDGSTWSHTVKGIVDAKNPAMARAAMTNKIWAEWQEHLSRRAKIKAKVDALESAFAADIQAKEDS